MLVLSRFLSGNAALKCLHKVPRIVQHAPRRLCSSDESPEGADEPLYDVVIAGGGMVGTSMACALGHEEVFQDKKILLLEAAPQKPQFVLPDKYSNRVCALGPSTVDLLSSFGAWEDIVNMRAQPVKRMQVWESCSDAMITLNHDDMSTNLAYIVENEVTQAAIMNQFDNIKQNVEIQYSARAKTFELPTNANDDDHFRPWTKIHLEDGRIIQTRLLIGADGFKSNVRQAAQINTMKWDYNQWGLVATLHLSDLSEGSDNNGVDENYVAWQRFLPTGPVAILPLTHNLSSLVWSTSPEEAKRLLKLDEESFIDELNNAIWDDSQKDPVVNNLSITYQNLLAAVLPDAGSFRQLPPTILGIGENSRAAFPLGLTHSNQYVKSRLALIGDAAHRIHPLAGQGVNLGFGDVTCLRDVLVKAIEEGSDLGALSHLLEYETQRQRKVLPVMFTVDGLQRLYGTSLTPVVLLRSLGLQTTNALKPIKDFIISGAAT